MLVAVRRRNTCSEYVRGPVKIAEPLVGLFKASSEPSSRRTWPLTAHVAQGLATRALAVLDVVAGMLPFRASGLPRATMSNVAVGAVIENPKDLVTKAPGRISPADESSAQPLPLTVTPVSDAPDVGQTYGTTLLTPTGSLPAGTTTSKVTVWATNDGTTFTTARSGTWKRWIRALPVSVTRILPIGSVEWSSASPFGNPFRSPAAFNENSSVAVGVKGLS